METKDANISETRHTNCPLCDAPLSDPNACSKCDWVRGYRRRGGGRNVRDVIACLLSIIPGAGHLYKGHVYTGVGFMIGTIFAGLAAVVAGTFTAGFGALLGVFYWFWVMTLAYWVDDQEPEISYSKLALLVIGGLTASALVVFVVGKLLLHH